MKNKERLKFKFFGFNFESENLTVKGILLVVLLLLFILRLTGRL